MQILDTFNWVPDQDLTVDRDIEGAVRKVKFGEGVTQYQRKSLKPAKRTFQLSFTRSAATINSIEQFLNARLGSRFLWLPPGGTQPIKVTCSKQSRTVTGITDKLSVTFDEEHY